MPKNNGKARKEWRKAVANENEALRKYDYDTNDYGYSIWCQATGPGYCNGANEADIMMTANNIAVCTSCYIKMFPEPNLFQPSHRK